MAPFTTAPGATPREVLLQRTRKAYQRFDLEGALRQAGLDHADASTAAQRTSQFALPLFDNEALETRTHREWVPGGPAEPATARALLLDDSCVGTFKRVRVVGADAGSNTYAMQHEAGQRGAQQWLHRLYICFDAEDPPVFCDRLAGAYARRHDAEAALLHALVVDSMPHSDTPQLRVEQVNRMLNYALNNKALKSHMKLMDTSMLVNEINVEYQRTLNQLALERIAQVAPGAPVATTAGSVAAAPFPTLPLPAVPPPRLRRLAPARGTMPVEASDFPSAFSHFVFASLLTKGEVIAALSKLRAECVKVMDRSLFHLHHAKTMPVADFVQVRIQAVLPSRCVLTSRGCCRRCDGASCALRSHTTLRYTSSRCTGSTRPTKEGQVCAITCRRR
jgi:dynein heavy chain, axonemal